VSITGWSGSEVGITDVRRNQQNGAAHTHEPKADFDKWLPDIIWQVRGKAPEDPTSVVEARGAYTVVMEVMPVAMFAGKTRLKGCLAYGLISRLVLGMCFVPSAVRPV